MCSKELLAICSAIHRFQHAWTTGCSCPPLLPHPPVTHCEACQLSLILEFSSNISHVNTKGDLIIDVLSGIAINALQLSELQLFLWTALLPPSHPTVIHFHFAPFPRHPSRASLTRCMQYFRLLCVSPAAQAYLSHGLSHPTPASGKLNISLPAGTYGLVSTLMPGTGLMFTYHADT